VAGNARPILDGAAGFTGWPGTAYFAADQAAAIEILKQDLRADDVVLVKGSRYRTWDVADWLRPGTRRERSEPRSHGRAGSVSEEVQPT
jgi:UDP-N-acetylmuramoyl-tripeptide--D-alanyl-D-alanine ligase